MKAISTPPLLVRPFLKWPGGKFRLVSTIQAFLPAHGNLIEPFVGAGALFLNTPHQGAILNDVNADLINVYQQLQKTSAEFIVAAKKLFTPKNNQAKRYYMLREHFNGCQDRWERAILFIYLNRHGYNGLCRYNLKGRYNVPFGDYQQPYFPQRELEIFCKRAKKAKFYCQDYALLLQSYLQRTDLRQMVFYCDPPYAPLSATANFTGYAAQRFTLNDQEKLANFAKALSQKGATVIISNHDTPFTREIYQGAKLHSLQVRRTISCQTLKREKVEEILACYSPSKRPHI